MEGTCVQTLQGHAHYVYSVCVSVDGSRLFSGGWGKIKVWRIVDGSWQLDKTLQGLDVKVVNSVCVSGNRLFSGGSTIKVWNVATGECLQTLEGHEDEGHKYEVISVCVSPDGSRLFSGSEDYTIKVWDVATGACVHTLEGHILAVESVCVSGNRLFSGSHDKTIKVWDVATGACVQTLEQTLEGHAESGKVSSLCVSGNRLFSGETCGMIKVWEPQIMREFVALKIAILRFRVVTDKIDKEPDSEILRLQIRALRVMKLHQYTEALKTIGTRAEKIGVTLDKYKELYDWCKADPPAPVPPAPAPPNAKKSKLNELWCKLRF